MDKLTWYDEDGRLYCRRGYEVALARLASYEATGMMPDEIVKMGMAYEDSKRYSGRLELKLMPYLNIGLSPDELKALMLASVGTCVAEIKAFDGIAIDRLCDLAEADRDGRLVVLPCKVGDTVWAIENPWTGKLLKKPIEAYANGMKKFSHGLYVNVLFDTRKINGTRDYETNHIGETIFFTREEAEKALEAMKDA